MNELLCPWEPSTYLFFSENVPNLIHYSHLVAILAALGIGIFIFASNPKDTVARLIFLMTSLFSVWAALDVILWATNRPDVVMFSWSLQVLIEPLTYTLAFYLVYVYLYKRHPGFLINLLITLLLLPLLILLPTTYNLEALSLSSCEAVEGQIAKYYTYIVHFILTTGIVIMGVAKIPKLPTRQDKLIAICFTAGLAIFLLTFTSGNIISSFTDEWTISQYGLFGMPIFSALIAYSIVRFKAFNAKIIATQMLVIVLAIAVVSLIALKSIHNVRIVAAITFILVCILGTILVRSVKREVRQREEIEMLAKSLEQSNKQQVALIHFITHQLKGFMAKSRMIFSMALEGDFGKVPESLRPMMEEGFASATKGAQTISEILNASNIKSGKVTMAKEPFEFTKVLEGVIALLKPNADAKGVALTLTAPETPVSFVGDRMQMENALKNLIDNSIKYTPKGKIDIVLTKEANLLRLTITDTGVGITPEDMQHLFTEGGHGAESRKVNVESTGFGLYIVKNIIEAHKGRVWAESEGAGKGAKFTVELPVA